MMSLNLYLAQLNPAKRYYTYVDAFNTSVLGTITLSSLVGKDMNLAGMGDYTMYIHPNEDGHAYIAKQVLNAIPDGEGEAKECKRKPPPRKKLETASSVTRVSAPVRRL